MTVSFKLWGKWSGWKVSEAVRWPLPSPCGSPAPPQWGEPCHAVRGFLPGQRLPERVRVAAAGRIGGRLPSGHSPHPLLALKCGVAGRQGGHGAGPG